MLQRSCQFYIKINTIEMILCDHLSRRTIDALVNKFVPGIEKHYHDLPRLHFIRGLH